MTLRQSQLAKCPYSFYVSCDAAGVHFSAQIGQRMDPVEAAPFNDHLNTSPVRLRKCVPVHLDFFQDQCPQCYAIAALRAYQTKRVAM
eukprot:584155-Amphidinium_carterae.1